MPKLWGNVAQLACWNLFYMGLKYDQFCITWSTSPEEVCLFEGATSFYATKRNLQGSKVCSRPDGD